MKTLFFIVCCWLLLTTVQDIFAQNPLITYRENYFQGHFFYAAGQEVTNKEVASLLEITPMELEQFRRGNKKMKTGRLVGIAAVSLFTASSIAFLDQGINQHRVITYAILGGLGLTATLVSFNLVHSGRGQIYSAVQNYNYKVSRGVVYQPKLKLETAGLGMALKLNF